MEGLSEAHKAAHILMAANKRGLCFRLPLLSNLYCLENDHITFWRALGSLSSLQKNMAMFKHQVFFTINEFLSSK